MKLASIIILVALGLSISNTPNQIEQIKLAKNKSLMGRKISINNRKNLMLVGFWNYKENITQGGGKFGVVTSAQISFDAHFIRNKNFPYYNKMNLSTTIKLENGTNFKFYNSTDIYRNIAEGEIDESSFAEETINFLENQNKTINYDIFYLDEIELSNNEIHLNGNFYLLEYIKNLIQLTYKKQLL